MSKKKMCLVKTKQSTTPQLQEITHTKKKKKKGKRPVKQNAAFLSFSHRISPPKFSLHFREKTFW